MFSKKAYVSKMLGCSQLNLACGKKKIFGKQATGLAKCVLMRCEGIAVTGQVVQCEDDKR